MGVRIRLGEKVVEVPHEVVIDSMKYSQWVKEQTGPPKATRRPSKEGGGDK